MSNSVLPHLELPEKASIIVNETLRNYISTILKVLIIDSTNALAIFHQIKSTDK